MNPMDIKWKIKEYYEQLYTHKFDNVDEIYQFLLQRQFAENSEKNN